jgi:hypothetical protein
MRLVAGSALNLMVSVSIGSESIEQMIVEIRKDQVEPAAHLRQKLSLRVPDRLADPSG